MEAIKDSLEIIKEFFLEILGFIIPGIALIVGFYFISVEAQQVFFNKFLSNGVLGYIIVLLGYMLGYLIYGIGQMKWLQSNFITDISKIEENIENSTTFIMVREDIQRKINKVLDNKLKPIRNLAMSYTQESDRKIYNFTFRADLCHSLSIVVILLGLIGLISSLINLIFILPINSDKNFIIFYFGLIIFSYFFQKARNRFLEIALKIIFPIYISKCIKSTSNNA